MEKRCYVMWKYEHRNTPNFANDVIFRQDRLRRYYIMSKKKNVRKFVHQKSGKNVRKVLKVVSLAES